MAKRQLTFAGMLSATKTIKSTASTNKDEADRNERSDEQSEVSLNYHLNVVLKLRLILKNNLYFIQ